MAEENKSELRRWYCDKAERKKNNRKSFIFDILEMYELLYDYKEAIIQSWITIVF